MAATISTIARLAGVIDAKMFCYRIAAFMRLGEDVGERPVTCYDKVWALLVASGRESTGSRQEPYSSIFRRSIGVTFARTARVVTERYCPEEG